MFQRVFLRRHKVQRARCAQDSEDGGGLKSLVTRGSHRAFVAALEFERW